MPDELFCNIFGLGKDVPFFPGTQLGFHPGHLPKEEKWVVIVPRLRWATYAATSMAGSTIRKARWKGRTLWSALRRRGHGASGKRRAGHVAQASVAGPASALRKAPRPRWRERVEPSQAWEGEE